LSSAAANIRTGEAARTATARIAQTRIDFSIHWLLGNKDENGRGGNADYRALLAKTVKGCDQWLPALE
jgi:hypothetical protein